MKKIFRLLVVIVIFFAGFSLTVQAEETVDMGKFSSKEEAVQALEGETGGEEVVAGSVDPNDGTVKTDKEEDSDAVPTLENSTEQKNEAVVEKDQIQALPVGEIEKQEGVKIDSTSPVRENPFLLVFVILISLSILVLFIYIIKRYILEHKK